MEIAQRDGYRRKISLTEQLVTTAQPSTGLTVLPLDYPSYL